MTTYGVTDSGFVKKTLPVLIAEIEAAMRSLISPTLNLLPTSVLGQINGIMASKLAELWDLQEAEYASKYPDSASGAALDGVSSITGCQRLPAAPSKVTLDRLNVATGTILPVGTLVSVGLTGANFKTIEEVNNDSGYMKTMSAKAVSVDTGEVVGNATTIDTIVSPITGWTAQAAITCANAGPYALSGKHLYLTVDGILTKDIHFVGSNPWSIGNAVTWISTHETDITASNENGYLRIYSDTDGTGSSIQITGGNANTELGFSTDEIKGMNSTDASPGRDIETDADYRVRRVELLAVAGSATVEAIRTDVLKVTDVIQCYVYENITDTTVSGLPPHSFEAVVYGGDDDAIAEAIWLSKPAGIAMYGTTTKTVMDSQGFTHSISFSRPTPVRIYIEGTLTTTTDFPTDGIVQVKEALRVWGATHQVGQDVYALAAHAVPLSIAGVEDVPTFKIDIVLPPTGTGNIVIDFDEIAAFDTSDMDITVL